MSGGKSVNGFNRNGGGAADGTGGFARPVTGGTLRDGLPVAEVFEEVAGVLQAAGYKKEWVDGWKRDRDGAVVTVGYSYREVRVRRYYGRLVPGGPQAVHNIRDYGGLQRIDEFIGAASSESSTWGTWDELSAVVA